jgi:hypothetical protein
VVGTNLEALTALILSISLATERLVVAVKTTSPTWFADEKKTAANETDRIADRWRRIRVLLTAFIVAFALATLIADQPITGLGFLDGLPFWASYGAGENGGKIATPLLALLASGGSAFWTSVVGFVSAARDVRVQQRAAEGLEFRNEAERRGVAPVDSGASASGTGKRQKQLSEAPDPTEKASAFGQLLTLEDV